MNFFRAPMLISREYLFDIRNSFFKLQQKNITIYIVSNNKHFLHRARSIR
ncbi:hypothetical protein CPter91_2425 [Collimonas pratensis]|uniref:Uncharacterized protein n=1 Tax=Collimonas pratensis TaxID=279113 RepID=A0A127Q429_9BURK|nr:hypothetical protein CPter91_2425 [Collimonas pratensis]